MSETTYSIGALCKEFDVTPRALRFYEYKELLDPIREGQRRIFTTRDRARLKLILRGKRFGFSLAEIKDLLDLYYVDDSQVTQLAATIDAAERHRVDLIANATSWIRPSKSSKPRCSLCSRCSSPRARNALRNKPRPPASNPYPPGSET